MVPYGATFVVPKDLSAQIKFSNKWLCGAQMVPQFIKRHKKGRGNINICAITMQFPRRSFGVFGIGFSFQSRLVAKPYGMFQVRIVFAPA